MNSFESFKAEDTYNIGKKLAGVAHPGMIVCLDGDLGVGKTVFTKGFAAGLGVTDSVSSPTFTIVQEYTDGRVPFYHFDVYRIADIEEMYEIGYEDYFAEGACVLEWASIIKDLIPPDAVWIKITKDLEKGFDYRKIEIEGFKEEL